MSVCHVSPDRKAGYVRESIMSNVNASETILVPVAVSDVLKRNFRVYRTKSGKVMVYLNTPLVAGTKEHYSGTFDKDLVALLTSHGVEIKEPVEKK